MICLAGWRDTLRSPANMLTDKAQPWRALPAANKVNDQMLRLRVEVPQVVHRVDVNLLRSEKLLGARPGDKSFKL